MQHDRRLSILLGILAMCAAALVGYLVVVGVTGAPIDPLARREVVLGVSEELTETAAGTTAIAALPGTDLDQPVATPSRPTPTFVPVDPTVGADPSLAAPPIEPTAPPVEPTSPPIIPTDVPIIPTNVPIIPTDVPIVPTEVVPTLIPPTDAPPVVVAGGSGEVVLDDGAWQGGWKQSRPYGGRSATWIYGTGTDLSAMQAVFTLPIQPSSAATLSIEGMDSEDQTKTPIRITVNGVVVYEGANPLPNDDQPIDTGTWATYSWNIDPAYLQASENTILIQTLVPGQFRQPPFFMLDYAVLNYT